MPCRASENFGGSSGVRAMSQSPAVTLERSRHRAFCTSDFRKATCRPAAGGTCSPSLGGFAVHDVKLVAGTEDDRPVGYLSGARFCDVSGRISLGRSLGDREVRHVDVNALVTCKLAKLVRRPPIIAHAAQIH